MKNKKAVALLVVIALLQLIFPLNFFVREKIAMNNVIEKGTSYTLDYTRFDHFRKDIINLDTDDIYTVGYIWDRQGHEDGYLPHDSISLYTKVMIKENETGQIEFYDAETCDKSLLTKDNWFDTRSVFHLQLSECEFVNDEFGLRELVELVVYCNEQYEDFDIDEYMTGEDGYYGGFYMVPLEGKVTIKVYDGFAKVTELYLGDELIIKSK